VSGAIAIVIHTAEWISEAIGKVEVERLKETKFDGTRSGHNFSLDRQIEPLAIGFRDRWIAMTDMLI
jgi:hypothetical protein